jgi:DNA-binding NarL/FixJ family response regulator
MYSANRESLMPARILASRKRPARIFIVDDHPMVREGMAARIASQDGLAVCGQAADAVEALAKIFAAEPDLVIVDLKLKGASGLDLIRQLLARDPSLKVLVSSMYPESLYAERVLRAGALGYVNKEELPDVLLDAVMRALEGRVYLSSRMANSMLLGAAGRGPGRSSLETLSDRELEVFRMIGDGLTTRQIAGNLDLSIKTIERHREKIKTKLDLKNAAELAQHAVRWVSENG